MTLLCESDPDQAGRLAAAVPGPVRILATDSALTLAIELAPAGSLVILGPTAPLATALALASRALLERPADPVVLLRHRPTDQDRARAELVGVRHVLAADELALFSVICAGELAALGSAPAPRAGRILTVFAAKGGCGKTTIAANLAIALSELGDQRVCLVDLDLGYGDLAPVLGLPTERTLTARVGAQLDGPDGVDAMITPFTDRIDCVLAPVGPGQAEQIGPQVVEGLLSTLSLRYEAIVIDTPARFTSQLLAALDCSHDHILVATPERPALRNLRLTLDAIDLLDYRHASRSVVFNRSDTRVGITAADVERTARVQVSAHIPSSRDVATSINRGEPLMSAHPQHPVSVAIRGFAEASLAGAPNRGLPARRWR